MNEQSQSLRTPAPGNCTHQAGGFNSPPDGIRGESAVQEGGRNKTSNPLLHLPSGGVRAQLFLETMTSFASLSNVVIPNRLTIILPDDGLSIGNRSFDITDQAAWERLDPAIPTVEHGVLVERPGLKPLIIPPRFTWPCKVISFTAITRSVVGRDIGSDEVVSQYLLKAPLLLKKVKETYAAFKQRLLEFIVPKRVVLSTAHVAVINERRRLAQPLIDRVNRLSIQRKQAIQEKLEFDIETERLLRLTYSDYKPYIP